VYHQQRKFRTDGVFGGCALAGDRQRREGLPRLPLRCDVAERVGGPCVGSDLRSPEAPSVMMSCGMAALSITLAIEVPLVAAMFPGQRVRMAILATIVNTVTNLTLNYVFFGMPWLQGYHVLAGETFALVGEAAAYAALSRPRRVVRSVLASGIGNALSFGAGFTPLPYLLCR